MCGWIVPMALASDAAALEGSDNRQQG